MEKINDSQNLAEYCLFGVGFFLGLCITSLAFNWHFGIYYGWICSIFLSIIALVILTRKDVLEIKKSLLELKKK